MTEESLRKLIVRLQKLGEDAVEIQHALRTEGIPTSNIVNTEELSGTLKVLNELLRELEVRSALARVNFKDDYYAFVRAIDGDTIVVEPPEQLRDWMKDIHVRLYGLETPEMSEELGSEYQKHLEELCAIDGKNRLMIVWERERVGTGYAGFPLASFERGIGHVFFQISSSRYLYVNGLMHLLKYSSLFRAGKNLLRGRRYLNDMDLASPWHGPCATDLKLGTGVVSPTMQQIITMRPPVCLISYPSLPNLDAHDERFPDKLMNALQRDWETQHCPFGEGLVRNSQHLLSHVVGRNASSFDVPLTYLSQWAAQLKT